MARKSSHELRQWRASAYGFFMRAQGDTHLMAMKADAPFVSSYFLAGLKYSHNLGAIAMHVKSHVLASEQLKRLARIQDAAQTVVGEDIWLNLAQDVLRCEESQDMTCANL